MTHDIDPFWGSHSSILEPALASLAPGSLVIEHGAGMYSSTLISRYDVRVLTIEEWPGWTSWARWVYESAGRHVEFLDRAKPSIPRLADAALVFIDGAARERADLLRWSLAAKVPLIITHDTERDSRSHYGYHSHLLECVPGYAIEHDGVFPRTTTWRRTA